MEFQKFCRERERMCSKNTAYSCPFVNNKDFSVGCNSCDYFCIHKPTEAEQIVSDWSKENPIVTNREKFMEIMRDNFLGADIEIGTRFGKDYIEFPDGWMCEEYKEPGGKDENN